MDDPNSLEEIKDDLVKLLNDELNLYKKILELSKEKTKIILENNLEKLKDIDSRINEEIEKIYPLEETREKIISKIGEKQRLPSSQINLSFLSSLWGETSFKKLQEEFASLLGELKEINQRNNLLIKQAQSVLSFISGSLYSIMELPFSYNDDGKIEIKQRGGYFEKEV
ncbi:MAG: flagellar protein FlgN [Candidatus Omnitrophica bacterium]|nr:flagellar protein FlgN [Candidatus Omnitrophota bacterium]